MAGWHHPFSGHEFKQIMGDSEGQGSLACFCSWGPKELETTKQLNNNNPLITIVTFQISVS